MARLLWLPTVLRAAGLTVHEVSGWATRGLDAMWEHPAGVICHATAGSRQSTPTSDIGVLVNGSASAPPPIAQLYLGRSGEYWVVASGLCYHAGSGGLWGVSGNAPVIGVEAANDNKGEPWPDAQYDSYVIGVAAILAHLGRPASRAGAHREWSTTGKTDPVGIDMNTFRAQVAAAMTGNYEGTDMTPQELLNTVVPSPTLGDHTVAQLLKDARSAKLQSDANAAALARVEAAQALLLQEVDGAEEALDSIAAVVGGIQAGDPAEVAAALLAVLPGPLASATADELRARLES